MDSGHGAASALTARPSYDALMEPSEASPELTDVARALLVLGGRGTLGDVVLATGLPCDDAQRVLEALMARGQVHVTVAESAVVTYRLEERRRDVRAVVERWNPYARVMRKGSLAARPPVREFDRKTLRLIRGRGGVLSVAELVEHTGLPSQEAMEKWIEEVVITHYGARDADAGAAQKALRDQPFDADKYRLSQPAGVPRQLWTSTSWWRKLRTTGRGG